MPVNLSDAKGNSLLMLASYNGQVETARMLWSTAPTLIASTITARLPSAASPSKATSKSWTCSSNTASVPDGGDDFQVIVPRRADGERGEAAHVGLDDAQADGEDWEDRPGEFNKVFVRYRFPVRFCLNESPCAPPGRG